MKKLVKFFVFDFIVAALFIALGVLMIVLPEFGSGALSYVAAALLVIYLALYLFPKVKIAKGNLQVLVIVESLIVLLIAAAFILKAFDVIIPLVSDVRPAQLVGIVLWLRGVCDGFRGYFLKGTDGQKTFPLWRFALALLFISAGAFFFAKPILSDTQMVIAIAVILFLAAAFLLYFGIRYLPKKKNGAKKAKKETKSAQAENNG